MIKGTPEVASSFPKLSINDHNNNGDNNKADKKIFAFATTYLTSLVLFSAG